MLTRRFFSSQLPEIPRWAWAFLDSLLVLGKHPRLPVDHAKHGCFFTVENDFILKTPSPQDPSPSPFLLGRAEPPGTAWSRSRLLLDHRKHYQIPLLPGWPAQGLQARRAGKGRRPVWDVGRSPCSLCMCVSIWNNLQPAFPWNFNSVTNTNGSGLLRERK